MVSLAKEVCPECLWERSVVERIDEKLSFEFTVNRRSDGWEKAEKRKMVEISMKR